MMRTYRAAVIGRTGRGNYGHQLDLVWKHIPNAQLVAVADENADGVKLTGARVSFPLRKRENPLAS